jgi:hypothetical protein
LTRPQFGAFDPKRIQGQFESCRARHFDTIQNKTTNIRLYNSEAFGISFGHPVAIDAATIALPVSDAAGGPRRACPGWVPHGGLTDRRALRRCASCARGTSQAYAGVKRPVPTR